MHQLLVDHHGPTHGPLLRVRWVAIVVFVSGVVLGGCGGSGEDPGAAALEPLTHTTATLPGPDVPETTAPVVVDDTTAPTTTDPTTSPPTTTTTLPFIPSDLLFDSGSSVLKSGADESLQALADEISARHPDAVITFVGHTDSQGESAGNATLSVERAKAVHDWFIEMAGFDPVLLSFEGRGESDLAVDDMAGGTFDPVAGEKNRRVQVIIGESS